MAKTTAGGASGKISLPGVGARGAASTASPEQPASLFPASHFPREQRRWRVPLNKSFLFQIPALLLKQSWGEGASQAPACLGMTPGGGSFKECLAAAAPPADSWRTGGLSRESLRDLKETQEACATHPLSPEAPELNRKMGKILPAPLTSRVVTSTGVEMWKDPGWEAGTRVPGPPHRPPAGRFWDSPGRWRASLPFLGSGTTLH